MCSDASCLISYCNSISTRRDFLEPIYLKWPQNLSPGFYCGLWSLMLTQGAYPHQFYYAAKFLACCKINKLICDIEIEKHFLLSHQVNI